MKKQRRGQHIQRVKRRPEIQTVKQYHLKPEVKEDHQLSPGGFSNRRKLQDEKLQIEAIIESDSRFTGVQLKSVAKLSTDIGLITKHTDCRITLRLYPIRLKRIITF